MLQDDSDDFKNMDLNSTSTNKRAVQDNKPAT